MLWSFSQLTGSIYDATFRPVILFEYKANRNVAFIWMQVSLVVLAAVKRQSSIVVLFPS